MALDLRLAHNWEEQSRFVKELLGFNEGPIQVGLYHGTGHAILDVLYGLKEFWPLKKNLVVITDGDPYLLSCLRTFVREGYQITQLKSQDLGNMTEWVNQLKSDTLAVLYSADHAFTGEVLVQQEFSERLSAKKINSVEIQHSLHAYSQRKLYPWHLQIQNFFPDLTVVAQGTRVRLFQHSAQLMDWSYRDLESEIGQWRKLHLENAEVVQAFERRCREKKDWGVGVRPYFEPQVEMRIWDRAVLKVENLGGDHLIHRIAEKINIKLENPGFSNSLETTHFCRWKASGDYDWWGKGVASVQEFQSLIAISAELLAFPDFFNTFTQVISTCQKETELL